jgi:predicted aldo/keto reductase-like oxidoreductase
MSTLEQIKENITIFQNDEKLNDEEEKLLSNVCEVFRSEILIPCTACRYCCNPCPSKIDIVKIIETYNKYKIDGPWGFSSLEKVECTECGLCNERCPQSIDIKGVMKEVMEVQKKFPH